VYEKVKRYNNIYTIKHFEGDIRETLIVNKK